MCSNDICIMESFYRPSLSYTATGCSMSGELVELTVLFSPNILLHKHVRSKISSAYKMLDLIFRQAAQMRRMWMPWNNFLMPIREVYSNILLFRGPLNQQNSLRRLEICRKFWSQTIIENDFYPIHPCDIVTWCIFFVWSIQGSWMLPAKTWSNFPSWSVE